MMFNLSYITATTETVQNTGFFGFIVKYADLLGFVAILIPIGIIGLTIYVRDKLFSNTSKLTKVDASQVELRPSAQLVGIDDIRNSMYINDELGVYSGVIETTGIPYKTLPEDDKNGVNAGYVGFLGMVNFPFSKHIVSKKIDLEKTETSYLSAYDRINEKIEALLNEISVTDKEIAKYDAPPSSAVEKMKQLEKALHLLMNDKTYMEHQIQYLSRTVEDIKGSTKSVYYSVSASLDEEALKGLSHEEEVNAYQDNATDRLNAMSNSLANIGVKSAILDDVELLDLARAHYKPHSSTVYRTKHLINEAAVESDFLLDREMFARLKIYEAIKKDGE